MVRCSVCGKDVYPNQIAYTAPDGTNYCKDCFSEIEAKIRRQKQKNYKPIARLSSGLKRIISAKRINEELIREKQRTYKPIARPSSGLKRKITAKRISLEKRVFEQVFGGQEPEKPSYGGVSKLRTRITGQFHNWVPTIFGIIFSVFIGYILLKSQLILAGGVLLSLSFGFSRTGGSGVTKALLMFLGILIVALGFYLSGYFFGAFSVLFIGYISFPKKIYTEEGYSYESLLAVFKAMMGFGIALFMFTLGGPFISRLSLFLITLGFFLVLPETSEQIQGSGGVTIINYLHERKDILAGFAGLLVLAGTAIAYWGDLELFSAPGIIFGLVGFTGAIVAFSTHSNERGVAGVPIIIILLLTITTVYPSILGEAIFGQWWPTVQHTVSGVTAPIITAFEQVQTGMSDAWLMMTCPSCYYEKKTRARQIKSGRTTGTVRGIEITKFESFMSEVDPLQTYSLAGTIELENKGDFDATNVVLELGNIYAYGNSGRGELEEVSDVEPVLKSCVGATPKVKSCKWEEMLPGDVKTITFQYNIKDSELGMCQCKQKNRVIKSIACTRAARVTAPGLRSETPKRNESPRV